MIAYPSIISEQPRQRYFRTELTVCQYCAFADSIKEPILQMHEAIISVVPRVHKQPFPGSVGHDVRRSFGGKPHGIVPRSGSNRRRQRFVSQHGLMTFRCNKQMQPARKRRIKKRKRLYRDGYKNQRTTNTAVGLKTCNYLFAGTRNEKSTFL